MKMSKGAQRLKTLLIDLLGEQGKLILEYHIGQSLRIDFYSPALKAGFEFHGRQHSEFVEHFHGDAAGFELSKRRDQAKIDLAAEQGICIVAFWHDEKITQELLDSRLATAMAEILPVEKKAKVDPWKEKQKEKAREARRQRYQWQKQRKKDSKEH